MRHHFLRVLRYIGFLQCLPERTKRKEMFLGKNQIFPKARRQKQHTMWRQRMWRRFFFFSTMEKSFQCAQWKELEGKSANGR